jgi:N-methylhydantoinase B
VLHDIGKRTVYRPELREKIRLWSGGGGGFGDPLEREPEAVARDVVSGLVSVARARDVYGVVLADGRMDGPMDRPKDGIVDDAATMDRRTALLGSRAALGTYDFGPGRTAWESLHGTAAELIADWLPGLPLGVQRYAQALAYRQLHESGPGPYAAPLVSDILARIAAELVAANQGAA